MKIEYKGAHLAYNKQIELLKSRGMLFRDEKKATNKMKFINYYKFKEFSLPYMSAENKYQPETYFEDIIDRFYWDKNLRLYFLRVTEKVEISLKTQISYILGRDFGATGYLKFQNWSDKNRYCKYYLNYKEKDFLKKLNILEFGSKNRIILDHKEKFLGELPVWLSINLLTLGDIVDVYTLLNKKYRKEIATNHGLDLDQFETWIKNIRLVRNLSAHNSNIIDVEFTTKPKIKEKKLLDKLHFYNVTKNITTNKIALAVVIMEFIVFKINPDFPGAGINKALKRICKNKTDEEAQKLGFKDFKTIEELTI